jgi:hypothetical protein
LPFLAALGCHAFDSSTGGDVDAGSESGAGESGLTQRPPTTDAGTEVGPVLSVACGPLTCGPDAGICCAVTGDTNAFCNTEPKCPGPTLLCDDHVDCDANVQTRGLRAV